MTAKTTSHAGPADNHHGKWPHCGACQCCGRGAGFYPYYVPYPWYPHNPWCGYTYISSTIGNTGAAAAAGNSYAVTLAT